MNLLAKLIFILKKPPIFVITGRGYTTAAEAIFRVLEPKYKVKRQQLRRLRVLSIIRNKTLILEEELIPSKNAAQTKSLKRIINDLNFLVKASRLSTLVVTALGRIPSTDDVFAAEKREAEYITRLTKALPINAKLILNSDDETVREIGDEFQGRTFSFGFTEGADFRATDVHVSQEGTNFKLNYQGNIVPVWLRGLFGKGRIYDVLAAANVGLLAGINLVKISETLKLYRGSEGQGRLIKGIKDSLILDDSCNADVDSMMEALNILGKIVAPRKIAVLGDILQIGKYTIEAHEAVGDRVAEVADMLFTVGARAKFFAKGAFENGMDEKNIFSFDQPQKAGRVLQNKIKPGDLILVDGSSTMKMKRIVQEIRAYD